MSRTLVNYLVVCLLFLDGLGLAVSGFIQWLILPGGGGGRGGGYAAGAGFVFSRHTWTDIHIWLAVIFMGLAAVHIALHWRWILQVTERLFSGRQC